MEEDELKRLADAPDSRVWLRDDHATQLLLIRHAQFDGTEGHDSSALSEIGRAQAEALAGFLARDRLDAVYSSPYLRALQTAGPIADRHGLDVRVLKSLREIDLRGPAGASFAEVVGADEAERIMSLFQEKKVWDVFGGVRETSAELRERAVEAIDGIAQAHPGGRVAVISHSPIIQAYLAVLTGSAFDLPFRTHQTSISLVEFHGADRQIHAIGARPHLHNF
ncbi:MAG TPA: histidine phosphatase family protein [Dehalococcoidia bacterium]